MRTTQTQQNHKIHWDTINSYYRWNIFLLNGIQYPGYSKRHEEPEVFCKIKLLKRCMIRLKEKRASKAFGYFTPGHADRIEIYKRTGLGQYKERLVTLYPTHYELSHNEKFNQHQDIREFLDLFYSMLKKGIIEQLTYASAKIGYSKINEDALFSMTAGRFKSIPELYEFGNELMHLGFTYERVQHFTTGFIEKNLSFKQ